MKTINSRFRGWSKRAIEKTLGVTIFRTKPDKSFYSELRYLRNWLPSDIVFDVGANDGRTVMRLQQALPSPLIYAFEPVSATFEILEARTRQMKNVRRFKVAMGARCGRQTICLNEIAAMNSFLPDWTESIGTESVEVTTVDRVMKDQGIDFVQFLKVDTEGYDLEVLKGASEALADSRIGIVQVEVRFDQPDILGLEKVQAYLAPFGYQLYGFYTQCRPQVRPSSRTGEQEGGYPGPLAYADTVFVCAGHASRGLPQG